MLNGEGGIRTPVRFDPKTDFESAAFNRSATSPRLGLHNGAAIAALCILTAY